MFSIDLFLLNLKHHKKFNLRLGKEVEKVLRTVVPMLP
jgi:hypothetical protein